MKITLDKNTLKFLGGLAGAVAVALGLGQIMKSTEQRKSSPPRKRDTSLPKDADGKTRQDYEYLLYRLQTDLRKARDRYKEKQYTYALHDARIVMENALKMVAKHFGKTSLPGEDTFIDNLNYCKEHRLLGHDASLYENLHKARKICNLNSHVPGAENTTTREKTAFVIDLAEDLLGKATEILCR